MPKLEVHLPDCTPLFGWGTGFCPVLRPGFHREFRAGILPLYNTPDNAPGFYPAILPRISSRGYGCWVPTEPLRGIIAWKYLISNI